MCGGGAGIRLQRAASGVGKFALGKEQAGYRREAAEVVYKVQLRAVGESPPDPSQAE